MLELVVLAGAGFVIGYVGSSLIALPIQHHALALAPAGSRIYNIAPGSLTSNVGVNLRSNNFSALMQTALNDIAKAGPTATSTINIGPGTYGVGTQIGFPSGNAGTINVVGQGAILKRTANIGSMLDVRGSTSNVSFSGLTVDGNNPAQFFIPGVPISTVSIGISFADSQNLTVQNCTFLNWSDSHAVGCGNSFHIVLRGNTVGQCGGFGLEGGCDDVLFENNVFNAVNMDFPLVAAGNALKNNNVRINGNKILHPSTNGGGIDVVATNVTITNNVITNPAAHLGTGSLGIWVHGNTAYGGHDRSSGVRIQGNTFIVGSKAYNYSIGVENSDNVEITGNNMPTGIVLIGATGVNIHGNQMADRKVDNFNNSSKFTFS